MDMLAQGIAHVFFGLGSEQHLKNEKIKVVNWGNSTDTLVKHSCQVHWLTYIEGVCDALQQNREQVVQAYFEIWVIEVGMGWFEIFFYIPYMSFYHM